MIKVQLGKCYFGLSGYRSGCATSLRVCLGTMYKSCGLLKKQRLCLLLNVEEDDEMSVREPFYCLGWRWVEEPPGGANGHEWLAFVMV